MNRENERKKILRKLCRMAFERSNDAVKLVFFSGENDALELEKLDLSMLSDVKRDKSGTVEVKLVNRLDAIKLALEELRAESGERGADMFLRVLDEAAKDAE